MLPVRHRRKVHIIHTLLTVFQSLPIWIYKQAFFSKHIELALISIPVSGITVFTCMYHQKVKYVIYPFPISSKISIWYSFPTSPFIIQTPQINANLILIVHISGSFLHFINDKRTGLTKYHIRSHLGSLKLLL